MRHFKDVTLDVAFFLFLNTRLVLLFVQESQGGGGKRTTFPLKVVQGRTNK